jgi:hypothetical protein
MATKGVRCADGRAEDLMAVITGGIEMMGKKLVQAFGRTNHEDR